MTQVTRNGFVNKNGDKVQILPAPHKHTINDVNGLNNRLNSLSDMFIALDRGKQDKLTFDANPTEGSDNPVTSGGVKAALDAVGQEPTRIISIEDAGSVAISLLESGSRGMVARISIENEGAEVLSAEINAANIANLVRALTSPDNTPTALSNNLVTSGGVDRALKNKTSISHPDMYSIVEVEVKHAGDDEYDQAKVIGKDRIVMGVGENAEDGSVIIDANNITNLQRALLNPDTTPTANSTNLVTSGGVKAALDGKTNYYDGHLTIYNEGQRGFPVAENSTVVQDLMLFIASVPQGLYYYTFVEVHKDNGTATFPCVVKWLERGTTTIVSINVSNHTFTAKQTGDQWDQAFTVANNSSFFEVL